MLIQDDKQKCKQKLITIAVVSFVLISFIIAIPFLLIFLIIIGVKMKKSLPKIIDISGIANCIGVLIGNSKKLEKYIEMLNKRKYETRRKKAKLRRKKNKQELIYSFGKEKDYAINKYNNKDIKSASFKFTHKKEPKPQKFIEKDSKSISSDFGKTKSIWDDYESVLDKFKK